MEASISQNDGGISCQIVEKTPRRRVPKPQAKKKATIGLFKAMNDNSTNTDKVNDQKKKPTDKTPSKEKQGKTIRPIIHPKLLEYAEHIHDIFWKELFTEMAHGKMPKGFRMKKDKMMFRNSSKNECIHLNPDSMRGSVYVDFIRDNGLIYSEEDQKAREDYIMAMTNQNSMISSSDCWKDIKSKKKLCYLLIKQYSIFVAKMYDMNTREKNNLQTMLNYWYMRNDITPDDIKLEDGTITSINGLVFDRNERNFKLILSGRSKTKIRSPVEKQLITRESVKSLMSKTYQVIPKVQGRRRQCSSEMASLLGKYFSFMDDSNSTSTIMSMDTTELQ